MRVFVVLIAVFFAVNVFASNNDGIKPLNMITGHVCDANTGEPLEGTKVKIKELNIVVYTDVSGNFTFQGVEDKKYNYNLQLISYEKLNASSSSQDGVLFFELEEVD